MAPSVMEHLEYLATEIGPRPLGSRANQAAADYVQGALDAAGLEVERQEFACPHWEEGSTLLEVAGESLAAMANTWSPPCDVVAATVALGTPAELAAAELTGRIAVLYGELSKGHGYGARSAYYFPEEHQQVVRLLEEKRPAALICASSLLGCRERLIRDWDFPLPSATVSAEVGQKLLQGSGQPAHLRIEGQRTPGCFANVIARKTGDRPERILFLAHLDTQADSPGACDNASGVAVLLALAERLAPKDLAIGLEWLVVNGEEVGGVGDAVYLGQRGETLGEVLAAINIDGVGQYLGPTSITVMGGSLSFQEHVFALKESYPGVVRVGPWYESDHTAFLFRGVPCIPIGSTGAVSNHHLPSDTSEWISPGRLEEVVSLVAEIVAGLQDRSAGWCRKQD